MAEPPIGSVLGGYRVDALIARGGMGVVYRATHLALDRPVALKVIARHLADDDSFRERFLTESRLAARLDHPNVVPVYDAREEADELFVAMRLIEGGDLKRRIAAEGPLPPAEAVELLGQVASALDAAHAAGIVHRDVKPHNILVDETGHAFLTDFGLAKALGESGALSGASIAGTVEYMSPEQWQGRSVGPATDIYSLGCVLYEAVTGIAPYARKEDDTEPEMPAGIDEVIARAVDKEPERRYPSAVAMIDAARECEGATPTATRVLSEAPRRADRGARRRAQARPSRVARRQGEGRGDHRRGAARRDRDRLRRAEDLRRRRCLGLGADRRRPRAAADRHRPALDLGDERPRRDPDPDRHRLGDVRRAAAAARPRGLRSRGRRGICLGREPANRRGPADRRRHRHGRGTGSTSGAIPMPSSTAATGSGSPTSSTAA